MPGGFPQQTILLHYIMTAKVRYALALGGLIAMATPAAHASHAAGTVGELVPLRSLGSHRPSQAQMALERKEAIRKLQLALEKAVSAEFYRVSRPRPQEKYTLALNAQQWDTVKQILSHVEMVPPPRSFSFVYPTPGYLTYLHLKDAEGKVIYTIDLHINRFMRKSRADILDPNRPHGDGVSESRWSLPDSDYEAFYHLKNQVLRHMDSAY